MKRAHKDGSPNRLKILQVSRTAFIDDMEGLLRPRISGHATQFRASPRLSDLIVFSTINVQIQGNGVRANLILTETMIRGNNVRTNCSHLTVCRY